MNAVVMMFLGAGVGFGILLVAQALRPRTQPIAEVFDAVTSDGQGYNAAAVADASLRDGLSSFGVKVAIATSDEAQLRKDLAVSGLTIEQHGLVKATYPAAFIVVTYLLWLLATAAGFDVSSWIILFIALAGAAVSFIIPDIRLRALAKQRRVAFRHALSAYLDLVSIIMSGGGGLLTALQSAADAGDGWAFAEIRAALDRARLSNRTPWSQLGVLSERFDIPELRDLVATAELAGSEGSRVTESVATKADVLRSRLQSEVEQSAESLTEQMLLPVGLLLVALFLFLGFAVFKQLGSSPQERIQDQTAIVIPHLGLSGR